MTSGSRGYHVVVPLARRNDYDYVREFSRDFATLAERRHSDLFTVEQRKANREGKILLDMMRNAFGHTSVAPYSVRARPGAPVATPLALEELSDSSTLPGPLDAAHRAQAPGRGRQPVGGDRLQPPGARRRPPQARRRAARVLTPRGHTCRRGGGRRNPGGAGGPAPDHSGGAAVGPGVRVRDHPGVLLAVARSQLGRVRPIDARAGARLVGVVGVRVGCQRPDADVAARCACACCCRPC